MVQAPNFIIIGAMKCATSTLHDQLARQPGVFMSTPKEPNFFSDDAEYARGYPWYQSLFQNRGDAELAGESSTHYTKLPTHPSAVERMTHHLPRLKLIYIMRHPIDRLISHYIHDWTERRVDRPIDQAVDSHAGLVEYSLYSMQLRPYLQAYGRDAVLPLFFDQLTADPQGVLARVCEFIGYRGTPRWDAAADPQNVSSDRMRKSAVRDLLVWNPVATWVRRSLIPQSWRDRIKARYQMRERPRLSDQQKQRLESRFNEDLRVLGSWLGVGLTCTTWKSVATQIEPRWLPSTTPTLHAIAGGSS
jgi:hypothetical protein